VQWLSVKHVVWLHPLQLAVQTADAKHDDWGDTHYRSITRAEQ
jgi:hypothetical protein